MQFDAMPLIDAANTDDRLRAFDVRVLIAACRHLSPDDFRLLKLEALCETLPATNGQRIARSNASKSVRRLCAFGYLIRGARSGIGGAFMMRLPRVPVAIRRRVVI